MKHFIKNLFIFQLILCIVISCSVHGYCVENDNYDYLLSCGYPEEFLKNITETTMDKIVHLHGDNKIIDVICETEYWPDNTAENAKVVINSVIAIMQNPDGDTIAGESICVYWEWVENKPFVKGEDFISVLWNDENLILESDTFYAEDYWKQSKQDEWNVSKYYRRIASLNMNTLGSYTKLKALKKYVGGSMVFNLMANSPIEVNSEYNKYFSVEYQHNPYCIWIILSVIFFAGALYQITKMIKNRNKK